MLCMLYAEIKGVFFLFVSDNRLSSFQVQPYIGDFFFFPIFAICKALRSNSTERLLFSRFYY